MDIVLELKSQVPAYEQIKRQIKAQIISGSLSAGDALPSMRGLARDLKVSIITTTRAYGDLEAEGLIATVQGRGCFVRGLPQETVRHQYEEDIDKCLGEAAKKAVAAGITLDDLQTALDAKYSAMQNNEGRK